MERGTTSRIYPVAKRVLDFTAALLGLVVLSPALALIAIAIKLGSSGPVLYTALRVGRGGDLFRMYKFRTMVINADELGGSSTPDDDARITSAGRFLRRYKLDELPQLLNVLGGTMSLVGPRPQVKWAVDLYTPAQRTVLEIQPGITDDASLQFPDEGEILRGSADPDHDYLEKIHPEKMRLSLDYLARRSLVVDLGIICRTITTVFKGPDEEIPHARRAGSRPERR